MDLNQPHPRINASMLPSHQGQGVCLLGMAKTPVSSGQSFQLTTSDGENVNILLQEPLDEYLHGLVEVVGQVNNRNEIECFQYIMFSEEQSQNFDMETYNKAVLLMHQVPEYWLPPVAAAET